MKIQLQLLKTTVFVCLILVFISPSANAAFYTFKQSGFTGGGVVTGSFWGIDTFDRNGVEKSDGWLSACFTHQCNDGLGQDSVDVDIQFSNGDDIFNSLSFGQVTDFSFNIKGKFLTFSYDMYPPDQVFFLHYDPDSGFISFFVDGVGEFEWHTDQPLKVSNVPLPSALGLFGSGIAWLVGRGRRKIHLT